MSAYDESLKELKEGLKGEVVLQDDPRYDEVRVIWNAMIDRRPAVIVQCRDATDAAKAIEFARRHSHEISIRGAGHNIAGNAVCDGGLMIDFSLMKQVDVEPDARRARVQPGATLADLDAATQAHGLATPVGINSTTGIAGLTLGGGFGWLTRLYGLTIDNLLSVELITVDGKRLRADAEQNSDLFWAVRGGGGNFGVITEFEFRLYPVGPEIFAGLIVFPFSEAARVLKSYRQFVDEAPEAINVWAVLRKAPPLPFLPEDVHGKEVVILPVFYPGEAAEAEKLIAPLRDIAGPVGEHLGPQPYTGWEQAFDPLLTPGARNYWKSHNFTELSDGALETVIEYAGKLPSSQCEIFIGLIGGVANRVPTEATAYVAREARFVLNVHARWDDAADDERCIAWARAFFKASAPYASAGAYVNFMTEEEKGRVSDAYGPNYDRLVRIKREYDPQNLLHHNQNIKP